MKSILIKSAILLMVHLCSLLLISCIQVEKVQTTDQPNVLLIMIDDLNDYLGCYGGHPQAISPGIDALAESGIMFANAHTNAGVCAPSRNSMFTGVYPHNSRDFGWTPYPMQKALQNNKTLIELFNENGYYTLGTGKLMHSEMTETLDEWGVDVRINYGPHASDSAGPAGHPSVPEPFRSINLVDGSFAPMSDVPEYGWTYGHKPYRYVSEDDRDLLPDELHAEWAAEKIRELEMKESDQPFFMGVGFVRPHTPLYAPKRFFDMFPLESIELPEILENDAEDCNYLSVYEPTEMGPHYYQALKEAFPEGDEGLKLVVQAYLACIAFVDEQVATVMEALENSKFKANTIVILTSDHGWQFGEKDYLYKNSPWEEGTRVPLIIRAPWDSNSGSITKQPVSLIDIFPTLVDVCKLQGGTGKNGPGLPLDGYSLTPILEDPDLEQWEGPEGALTLMGAGINKPVEGTGESRNPGALWHIQIIRDMEDEYVLNQNYSWRTEDWRYIRYRNGKEELYHCKEDPYEWNNLALSDAHAEKKMEMHHQMMDLLQKRYPGGLK